MVSTQLFVTLAAALILDGAFAYSVPECAHKENHTLCRHLRSAHLQNMATETILKGNESLKDIRDGVLLATEAVLEALNTTDTTRLLSALKRALQLENAVLSHFKPSCETVDSCSKGQLSLMQTIFVLVEAIMEATLGNQKEAVTKAFEAFRNSSENLTGLTDRARKMATDVLAVI